jgi:hypothetical protein
MFGSTSLAGAAIPSDRPETSAADAPEVSMIVPILALALFAASVIFFELGAAPLNLFG